MHHQTYLLSTLAAILLLNAGATAADKLPPDVLTIDSFESGTKVPDGWEQGHDVPGVKYIFDRRIGSDGKRSLSLEKTANRYFPIASWSRTFKHNSDKPALKVSAKVKASKVTKAIIDVQYLDANDKPIEHEWVAYIGQKESTDPVATHDWKVYDGAAAIPEGTKKIGIALQIYGPGKVWFDELEVRYVDSAAAKANNSQSSATPPTSQSQAAETPAPIELRTASGAATSYLLIPPSDNAAKPATGYPLWLVLPGGDGSADFHSFVRSVHAVALSGRCVVAQPLAPPHIVWPTKFWNGRLATTEESVAAIINDVAKRHSIDRKQVYALAWSSSGPAVYATLLGEQSPLTGALIAMSVFKPDQLPPLTSARGRRIYLLHSPDDEVCPYGMAKHAQQQLASAGAQVTLVDYAGGHGWHGPVHDNIRKGAAWLQQTQ